MLVLGREALELVLGRDVRYVEALCLREQDAEYGLEQGRVQVEGDV